MRYLIFLLLIMSCDMREPIKRRSGTEWLTPTQEKYLSSTSLEMQAYMDDCLDHMVRESRYSYCYRQYRNISKVTYPSNSRSFIKDAASTAIGIGAAKAIFK